GLTFEDDGTRLAVRAGQELYVFPLDGAKPWPLALADAECPTRLLAAPLERIELSRDRQRAFARGGKLPTPELAGVTAEAQFVDLASGTGRTLEGLAALKSPENLDLSPDGEFLFAFDVDRSAQPPPTLVPDYLTERVSTRETRRELAEDTWPPRKPFVWSTNDGARHALELPGDSKASANGIGWAPRGEPRVAFRRTSPDYREVETWIWDRNGQRLALVERDEHWVGGPGSFVRWTKDGERLLLASECAPLSTTPGRNQVFELDPSNGALRQLTEVEGEVERFLVTEDDTVIVCASRNDPARRELGVVEANGVRWLPVPPGMNTSPTVSADGRVLVFLHEELGVPGELYRVALDGGAPATRLTSSIPAEYLARDWILPEKLTVASADGKNVRAHVYSPRGTSLAKPPKSRPCVVFIHGAGYLQNVTDSMTEYAVNLMFHSRLAEQGYVVADVDYRGSAGYGAKFRGDVQFQLGKLELEDIGAVVDELARRGAIDPTRVACYGGSYGGFLTLMALFKEPERWAGGAALRSVTDWRTYHPGYTQPRLGRPSTHPEAYVASSPIDHAQNLKDPLLLLHGMVDSNVFAQDTIRLMEKLIDLGLDFDAMLYPSQNHAFEDGMHWLDEYKRIERFLARCLAP
ncbi:MAG: S9 family peptidase, partial [Planctomycetota bacterium]|nr:S9 family peptidase [Planctomycetota bacterium]